MIIDILTLFPEMFKEVFHASILVRAQKKGLIKINIHNLRDWTTDKHHTVDDTPYGGGAGMVLKVDVIDRAIASLKRKVKSEKLKVILLTPKGKNYTQKIAQALSQNSNLILICGHYEGFDERVRELVDEEISIGNYVLTGGEIPAMVLVDSISRLVPGVLNPESLKHESFSISDKQQVTCNKKKPKKLTKLMPNKLVLEYPQYTRPEKFIPTSIIIKKSLCIPKVLLSGNHAEIEKWRESKRKIVK